MDFSTLLTSLWGKISKPVPNILVGLVFIFLAPENVAWAGYIFTAIGAASLIEWLYPKLFEIYKNKKLENKIRSLPENEFKALNRLRVNGHESMSRETIRRDGLENFEVLMSLEAKGLVTQDTWSNYGGSGYSFYLPYSVQTSLKDIIKEDAG